MLFAGPVVAVSRSEPMVCGSLGLFVERARLNLPYFV